MDLAAFHRMEPPQPARRGAAVSKEDEPYAFRFGIGLAAAAAAVVLLIARINIDQTQNRNKEIAQVSPPSQTKPVLPASSGRSGIAWIDVVQQIRFLWRDAGCL